MKKVISFALVIVMAFTLFACSSKKNTQAQAEEDGSIIFTGNKSSGMEFGEPEQAVNPQQIFDKIQYTPKMLYGRYCIDNWFAKDKEKQKAALTKFTESVGLMNEVYKPENDYSPKKISTVPFNWEAGIETLNLGLVHETKYNWVQLTFTNENGSWIEHQFKYEIEGNKLILTGVDWDWNSDTKKLDYHLLDDVKLEYEFKIVGRNMTLSKDGKSIVLHSGKSYNGETDQISCSNYLTDDSPRIKYMEYLYCHMDADDGNKLDIGYPDKKTGFITHCYDLIMKLSENGLMTITFSVNDKPITYQFAYILCCDDGMILIDNQNTYYMTDSYWQYMKKDVQSNVDINELEGIDALSEKELEKLQQTKASLMTDLTKAFDDAGIQVTVDEKTGELAMDATVLFGGDSAEITAEGGAFLDKFIKAYSTIITNEKYADFISKTMVEGHIAPIAGSTYESGLPLSTERAQNVLKYCLASKEAVDVAKLKNTMEAVGLSNSKPVLDANGEADIAASRRVSFRFIINLKSVK